MSKCNDLLERARNNPAGLRFTELVQLAECYGWLYDRTGGSHQIYKRTGHPAAMNFQDRNGKAVAYQVRQLLKAIDSL